MAKVLIVEDEPNLRLLYELNLRREGFEVTAVTGSQDCLSCLEATNPDVVVLDIMMPGRDGIETLFLLRIHDKTLPVILYTAFGSYRDNFLTWAADECLVKSADTSELIEAVKRLSSQHELTRDQHDDHGSVTTDGSAPVDEKCESGLELLASG